MDRKDIHVYHFPQKYCSILHIICYIEGIQVYPAKWPCKVQITLTNKELKQRLLIQGLDILGKHIELKDEDSTIVCLTIQDALIEWTDDLLFDIFSDYGTVLHVDKEYIYHDGRRTT